MANVVVTLTIAEADVPAAEKALCSRFDLEPINGANAKLALQMWVKELVVAEKRREQAIAEPTIT